MGLWSALFGESVEPTPIVTAAQYDELVIGAGVPVIVDVWSPTCVPCKKLAPVLVDVATSWRDKVRVVTVNSHAAEPALMARLGVRATPTLIIYDQGEEYGRMTGFRPKGWFDDMIRTEFAL